MTQIIGLISEHFFETIISLIVAYIGYRQWKTSEEEKRLNLFEKRFNFYTKCMLNPIWPLLFYDQEKMSANTGFINDKNDKYLVEQAYFIFPKRIYNKVALTISKMHVVCGYLIGINIIKEYPCMKNSEKNNIDLLVKYLKETFSNKAIEELKKDYEKACDILYDYIVIEKQTTLWRIIADLFIGLWDFIIPYNCRCIEEKRKTEEQVKNWLKQAQKDKEEGKDISVMKF